MAQNCARAETFHFEAFGQVVLPQPDHGSGVAYSPHQMGRAPCSLVCGTSASGPCSAGKSLLLPELTGDPQFATN
jgi:hypothetical protein